MMIEKYYCDLCKQEVESNKNLSNIYIRVKMSNDESGCIGSGDLSLNVCNKCSDDIGIPNPYVKEFAGISLIDSFKTIVKKLSSKLKI